MKGVFYWLSMNLPRYPASEQRTVQTGSENEERRGQDDDYSNKSVDIDNLMPDIYGQASGDTEPFLKIIKDQPQATDKFAEVDSCDTARFHKE